MTLRELMATIGHSSHVAALRYQHATAERSKAIANYLDDVIESARSAHRVRRRSASSVRAVAYRGMWQGPASEKRCIEVPPACTNKKRRRAESNRRTGLCRPLPKPLGHAAVVRTRTGGQPNGPRSPPSAPAPSGSGRTLASAGSGRPPRRRRRSGR